MTRESWPERSRRTAARWWDAASRPAKDAAADRRRRRTIHRTWRGVVRAAGLSATVHAASGVFRITPRITRIVLGRSERFTILLGRGQDFDDIEAAGKEIARAFDVPRIRLTELPADQLEIELHVPASDPRPEPTPVVTVTVRRTVVVQHTARFDFSLVA